MTLREARAELKAIGKRCDTLAEMAAQGEHLRDDQLILFGRFADLAAHIAKLEQDKDRVR